MTADERIQSIIEATRDPRVSVEELERLIKQYGDARARDERRAYAETCRILIDAAVEAIDKYLERDRMRINEMKEQVSKMILR